MSVQQLFTSSKNYLKRHPKSGSATIAAPSTLNGATNLYERITTIPHGLGYVPMVRVYYEPFTNGRVYPATGSRVSGAGTGLNLGDVMCLWELDENNLTITLASDGFSAVPTGSRTIYWVIYWDN